MDQIRRYGNKILLNASFIKSCLTTTVLNVIWKEYYLFSISKKLKKEKHIIYDKTRKSNCITSLLPGNKVL